MSKVFDGGFFRVYNVSAHGYGASVGGLSLFPYLLVKVNKRGHERKVSHFRTAQMAINYAIR